MRRWYCLVPVLFSANGLAIEVDDLFSLSLEALNHVTVTGPTLTERTLRSAPSAISVFTAREINRLGMDYLGELMNMVPGFQSYRSSGSSLHYPFSARGRRVGNTSSEILLLVDGQRVEEPGTSGSAQVIPLYPLGNIARVEFIRGPGAAIYGSNAMTGVINIVSRSRQNAVTLAGGDVNRRQATLQAGYHSESLHLDLFALVDEDNGEYYANLPSTPENELQDVDDPRRLKQVMIKAKWHDTALNYQHYDAEASEFVTQVGASPYNRHESQRDALSLEQHFDWLQVQSSLLVQYTHTRYQPVVPIIGAGLLFPFSDPPSTAPAILSFDTEGYSASRLQWHNSLNLDTTESWQWGMEYRHIDSKNIYTSSNYNLFDLAQFPFVPAVRYYGQQVIGPLFQEQSDRDIFGLYAQYQHQFNERWELNAGARYDHFSSIGERVSPRAGLLHYISKHHTLKLLYGEAFRVPAENELNFVPNLSLSGNKDLKPEVVKTWDLIWLAQWNWITLSTGYFESHFDDAIVLVPTGNGAELQYRNEEQGPVKGIELETTLELNNAWWIRAAYTHYTDLPKESFREADSMASLSVNYTHKDWNINVGTTHHGSRQTLTDNMDNLNRLDAYSEVFAKLVYSPFPHWKFFLQAKNLSNRQYATPTINFVLPNGVPSRGSEWLGGFEWKF